MHEAECDALPTIIIDVSNKADQTEKPETANFTG